MITLPLLGLTVLSVVAMHRFPSLFIPRKSKMSRTMNPAGENWIEVMPAPRHHELAVMQEAI